MKRVALAILLVVVAVAGAVWLWSDLRWTRPTPAAVDLSRVAPPKVERTSKPNVVLVIGCSVRADQLTPYDPSIDSSPFLAKLAREGVNFADTIAQAPWTKPAVTAIVTGQEPLSTGIPDPGTGVNTRVLAPDNVTLAERFHDAGYTTVGLTGNPNINTLFGFDQGFDVYVDTPNLWRDLNGKVEGAELVRDGLDVVSRLSKDDKLGPLYLQILFVDAHFPTTNITEADADQFQGVPRRVAEYRAMLRKLDQNVELLFDGLAGLGFRKDDLLFVFVGDHGDGLYFPTPSQGVGHGNFLYESTVLVPWIAWGLDLPANARVLGTSAQVDVVPTLLSLAGIEGSSSYQGPGVNLEPVLRGQNRHARRIDPERRVFTDTWFKASNRAAVYTMWRMCQKNFGTANKDFPDACFDRSSDSAMEKQLVDAPLTQELLDWRALRQKDFDARTDAKEAELGPDVVRELKALGYVE